MDSGQTHSVIVRVTIAHFDRISETRIDEGLFRSSRRFAKTFVGSVVR